jgi:hypothetical protein
MDDPFREGPWWSLLEEELGALLLCAPWVQADPPVSPEHPPGAGERRLPSIRGGQLGILGASRCAASEHRSDRPERRASRIHHDGDRSRMPSSGIAARNPDCVFLLWGAHAIKRKQTIEAVRGHGPNILMSSHPAPPTCYLPYGESSSFMKSRPFSKAKDLFASSGHGWIDWNLAP